MKSSDNTMLADVVLSVTNLSKRYDIYKSPSELVIERITGNKRHKEFWALKDVSFDVRRGEILGIIGRNGAGKSTLLKLVTGTLDSTAGEIRVRGRIAAILELGTGFHPEYTGRQNIIMGGLCLGLSREEIEARVPFIIEFSELEKFIDQPFKTYSSGMQARLTFSTALSVDPDILIVDEALAVGDVLFQEKCTRRMREFCDSGKTILFVTHSLQYIYEFCTRCILLSDATVVADGAPAQVGEVYERLLASDRNKQNGALPELQVQDDHLLDSTDRDEQQSYRMETDHVPPMPDISSVMRNESTIPNLAGGAYIDDIWVENEHGVSVERMLFGRRYRVVVQVRFETYIPRPNIGFKIQRDTGIAIIGDTVLEKGIVIQGHKDSRLRAHFDFQCRLAAGTYLLGGGVTAVHDDSGNFDLCDLVRGARVLQVESPRVNALVDPASKIWVTKLAKNSSAPL